MIRIIIKQNSRTLFNFQILGNDEKSVHEITETISTSKFILKYSSPRKTALKLTKEVINEFLRRSKPSR